MMRRQIVIGTFLGALTFLAVRLMPAVSSDALAETPPKPPLGLPPVQWPEDNPYSAAKAELGRFLYFDNRLSSDATISCASCHAPEKAFADGSPVATGIGGQKGGRSAPTPPTPAYTTPPFSSRRHPPLQQQANT